MKKFIHKYSLNVLYILKSIGNISTKVLLQSFSPCCEVDSEWWGTDIQINITVAIMNIYINRGFPLNLCWGEGMSSLEDFTEDF